MPNEHRIRRRRRLLAAAVAAIAIAGAGTGAAFAGTIDNQASPNWAGWVALAVPRSQRLASHFTTVRASWIQPSAVCASHHSSFAAFWIGLGGYALNSRALEQIGSEADCDKQGQLFYYAWYEAFPGPPFTIHEVKVKPGQSIAASVHVSGDQVTFVLTNGTTGKTFTKRVTMDHPAPDTSAADWITEAPSNCNGANHCRPLLLTDFGQVGFTASSASSIGYAGSHTGPIDDPEWDDGEIVLSSNGRLSYSPHEQSYALPSVLEFGGTAFTVHYGPGIPGGSTGASGATGATGASGATGAGGASAPAGQPLAGAGRRPAS